MRLRKLRDHVHGDDLPLSVWDQVGVEHASWFSQEHLGPVASVAGRDVGHNVSGHPRPPVVAGYKFVCLPPSGVAGGGGVMVFMHEVVAEFGV